MLNIYKFNKSSRLWHNLIVSLEKLIKDYKNPLHMLRIFQKDRNSYYEFTRFESYGI